MVVINQIYSSKKMSAKVVHKITKCKLFVLHLKLYHLFVVKQRGIISRLKLFLIICISFRKYYYIHTGNLFVYTLENVIFQCKDVNVSTQSKFQQKMTSAMYFIFIYTLCCQHMTEI